MAEPEPPAGGVGVALVVIDIAMVATVIGSPHQNTVLQGTCPPQGKKTFQGRMGLVGLMCPEAMIAARDRQTILLPHAGIFQAKGRVGRNRYI